LYIDLVVNISTIPFHLKSTHNEIIFNSMSNSTWFEEIELKPNPLIVKKSFAIKILIDTNEGFNVNISEIKYICLIFYSIRFLLMNKNFFVFVNVNH
jgi:hypothetical protein